MKDNFEAEFRRVINVRVRVAVVSTAEERRAISLMTNVCTTKTEADLFVWDLAAGCNQVTGNNNQDFPNEVDPTKMLDAITKLPAPRASDKPKVFVLKDFHEYWNHPPLKRRLRNASQNLPPGISIIITTPTTQLPVELRDDIPVLELALPREEDLRKVLDDVVTEYNVPMDLDEDEKQKFVQAALGMSASQAEKAFRKAAVKGGKLVGSKVQIVIDEKRQIIRQSEALDFYPVTQSFDDIGGLERLKEWLRKRNKAFGEDAKKYDLPPPKGIALIGIPGTGKSLTAKTIGHIWRLPLLRLDVGSLFGGLVGESEENTRSALSVINAMAPCILWIDEIEKAFSDGDRDGGTSGRVFGNILTWMQDKPEGIFVVGTANDVSRIPPELLRKGRFDEVFFLDLPTEGERKKIFEVHLKKRNRLEGDFDLDILARESEGFVGSEIEQLINDALYISFNDNMRPPNTEDVLAAIKSTVPLAIAEKERIGALREWLKQGRAVSASAVSAEKALKTAVNVETLRLGLIPEEED
jgi:SpoVK/Ycf46/Vps4 family AAA+-type ATPase